MNASSETQRSPNGVLPYLQNTLESLGNFTSFLLDALSYLGRLWHRRNLFIRHCDFIGVSSTGIITIAAIFLGGVLGYQMFVSLHYFGAEALLGGSVGVSVFRELGPVMAAIMVTGRAGAAMCAELASMRISEQIDALEVMAVDPYEYLVTPRIIAGFLMVPLLSLYFSMICSMAAAGVACGIMGLSYATYWQQFSYIVDTMELKHCLVKGAVFGLVMTWVACYFGFHARGGAKAVGEATRTTVVVSFLIILLSDYILTSLLPFGWAYLKVEG